MEFPILILFAFSIPIFWAYGLFKFLKGFLSPDKTTQTVKEKDSSIEFLADLLALKSKKKTLNEIISKYQLLLGVKTAYFPEGIKTAHQTIENFEIQGKSTENIVTQDVNDWWERWYQENNINLLLYIGAFLVVASAAIFVGFNWETLTGSLKASIFGLMTLAFFACGFYLYLVTPKLKNAGSTFLAIGSLLIPFNGLAWYNFVLSGDGISFGTVWLFTSFVSILVYFSLALVIRNQFYTYIAGLGGLSLVEALVNVSSLNSQFYILGGIFSAFSLLGASKLVASLHKEDFKKIYSLPLEISSHVVMPIFLAWGLLAAYSTGKLFTMEVTTSTFIASAYYFLAYMTAANISFFAIGELLLMLFIVLISKTYGFSGSPVFYIIFLAAFFIQVAGYFLKQINKQMESYFSIIISIYSSGLALFIAFIDPLVNSSQRVFLSLIVGLLSLSATYIGNQVTYLYFAVGAADLASFVYINDVLANPDLFKYLSLSYSFFGILLYFVGQFYRQKTALSWILITSAAVNFGLGFIFAFPYPTFSLIVSLIITGMLLVASYQLKIIELAYFGVVFFAIATFQLLQLNHSPIDYYPLAFTALSFVVYLAHLAPIDFDYRETFRKSALGLTIMAPVVFGLISWGGYSFNHNNLELFALISAYAASILLAFDALNTSEGNVGYVASASALLTILWQYKYLGVNEVQIYTITIALYFLGLGYLKRGQKKIEEQDTFNFIGLGFLIFPLTMQAFPDTGFLYALLLGAEGVSLIALGFSLNYKIFTYAGAAAICLATLTRILSFISSIPSWATIGLGGLFFLGVAIFLMSKRTPET